jgi:CheY-like chemotaxis protein
MTTRVLVVDDDDALRSAIADMLREEGYETEEAADGIEARECLESGARVDAILLDVMMPRMNGVQFRAWQVASAYAAIPVIVATAASQPPAELLTAPLRAGTVMRKPFDLDLFLAELALLVARD